MKLECLGMIISFIMSYVMISCSVITFSCMLLSATCYDLDYFCYCLFSKLAMELKDGKNNGNVNNIGGHNSYKICV